MFHKTHQLTMQLKGSFDCLHVVTHPEEILPINKNHLLI